MACNGSAEPEQKTKTVEDSEIVEAVEETKEEQVIETAEDVKEAKVSILSIQRPDKNNETEDIKNDVLEGNLETVAVFLEMEKF